MGICSSKKNPLTILLLGLDEAGKTTLSYKIQNRNSLTIPTIGFNIHTINPLKGVHFNLLDVGGGEKVKVTWNQYYGDAAGILYVVDSSDKERLQEAKEVLHQYIVNCETAANIPIGILANKQDVQNALNKSDLAYELGLHQLTNRKWFLHGVSAKTGDGLLESMKLMSDTIKKRKSKTTLLYKYKNVDLITTIPTFGFKVETVNASKDVKFSIWDVGGGDKIKILWRHYIINASGALSPSEIAERLDLSRLVDRQWFIYGVSALRGDGIHESLNLMTDMFKTKRPLAWYNV
ncbi:ARF1_2 [Mytilus coruscus]|uniref:ARF1_2 n=1 Tax=Mytilus coruscus TaxID=42192 RepID=A0A6J8CDP7_MYTCO|nr:ARF1_2 [Mytilus coruscus]